MVSHHPHRHNPLGSARAALQSGLGLAIGLLATGALAQTPPHVLSATNRKVEIQGVSGGPSLVKDCAAPLADQPSQEIVLTESLIQQSGFLKFSLEAAGSPVLVLDGPAGRFCALGDGAESQQPEVSGYWLPGTYRVYVGDRDHTSHTYTLRISQEQS